MPCIYFKYSSLCVTVGTKLWTRIQNPFLTLNRKYNPSFANLRVVIMFEKLIRLWQEEQGNLCDTFTEILNQGHVPSSRFF